MNDGVKSASHGAAGALGNLKRRRLAVACGLMLGLAACAGAVHAQAPAGSSAGQADGAASDQQIRELDAVVTTASRIRSGGFIAPTPTTQITAEEIDASGLINIADVINTMPSVRPSLTPTSSGNNYNYAGGNYLDLRGLGFSRTLVLVNGRRFVPTQVEGPVDINVIPQALVDNVDIVTGGASAAWGSDAVAGVVNLLFNTNFEGIKGKLQYGSSDHGDYRSKRASFALGQRFAGDRGHLLVAAEASDNSGIARLGDRDWGAMDWGRITNPAYTPDNDEPRLILVPNARSSNRSYGGLITEGPLAGIQFDSSGNPVPFEYGEYVTATQMMGGDGTGESADKMLAVPHERKSVYGRMSFDLTNDVSAYAELSWAKSAPGLIPNLVRDTPIRNMLIHRDNPFLPGSIVDAMDEHGLDSFRMGRTSRDFAREVASKESTTERAVFGLEGHLDGGWQWDAYYTYGTSETTINAHNQVIVDNFNYSRDAVLDPVTGAIVCRDMAARAAGCVPINLFGEGAPSREARDYVTGTSFRHSEISQHAAAATISGDAFELPAGPISVAAGVEWRREEASLVVDERSGNGDFAVGQIVPWKGSVNVREVFSEVMVPLVRDKAWAQSLDLNLAGRVTHYSTSGAVSTWKAGVTWDVGDMWRVRATRSRDIRAPSLSELYSGTSPAQFSVFDPEMGGSFSVLSLESGNQGLDPEKADTTTVGVIFNPTPNLMVSLDWYNIEITDAIITLQAAAIVNRCYDNQPQLCGLIFRGDDGRISRVEVSPQNLQVVELRGADLELLYRRAVAGGHLTLRGLVAWTDRLRMDDGVTEIEMAGTVNQPTVASVGGTPHWNGNLSAGFQAGRVNVGVGVRYVGGGKVTHELTYKDRDVISASSRTYYDFNASYDLSDRLALFGSVRNAFDKTPPIIGGDYSTIRSLYDVIGRTYTVGVRFDF